MLKWIGRLLIAGLILAGAAAAADRQFAWLRGWDGHGRSFDLTSLRGQVVILTFASKNTRDEASDINDELTRHAVAGDVTVVSVIDLEDIPGFGYKTARKKIADADQPGIIHHLVDERGALRRSFRVDPLHEVPIFVIGRDGAVLGQFSGEEGLPQALALVERVK
ncbi:MAG TPA: hypothetical protein VFF06_06080 [Polyangia bacterium]|nr:hypothetical protein [Polyangia bacterium]